MYSNDNTSSSRLLIMGDEFLVWSIAVWYRSAYNGCREKISLFLCFIIIAMGASNRASKIADWQADQSVEKCNRITHFCAPVRPSIGRSAVGARSLLYLSSSPGWWPWRCRRRWGRKYRLGTARTVVVQSASSMPRYGTNWCSCRLWTLKLNAV